MSEQTTICQQCGSAAIATSHEGTLRRTAYEPPPVIIATIACPKCGTRQQPEKPIVSPAPVS